MIKHMLRDSVLFLASIGTLLAASTALAGSTPMLSVILPRGVQRGLQHTLRFSGARLNDPQEIFFYDRGVEVVEIKQVDPNNLDVTIKVAADCRLGEHVAQVRTSRGISDYRSFYVGSMPEIDEQEPNNSLDTPQQVQQNVTINGVIKTEDVDMFAFDAAKGQRLSIEIEAIRLGYMFDPFIALLNSQRFEIAVSDDTALFRQDGFITVTIPDDGQYFVLVRESAYGGDDNCRYRLHLGDFPRPSIAYPAGSRKNEEVEITFIGDPRGPVKRIITVPDSEGFRDGLFVSDDLGQSPSPVSFRPGDLANHLEVEPNDDWKQITDAAHPPIAFNGIIQQPGDDDYFRFVGKKDQVWEIECYARRIRSGLDPVLHIFDANRKTLVGDDDARRPDSYLRFTVPADGEYLIRVRDHLQRGQSDFVYRIEMAPIKPSLAISIPRVDRYSQTRQQISVAKGNRFATLISGSRENFGGQLKLLGDSLPAGVTMIAQPMAANLNLMPVVFEAAEDAELGGALVDFRARHFDAKKEESRLADGKPAIDTESTNPWEHISGSFMNIADFALGQPNNARYYGCRVDRLAMAVTEKLPFKIELVQPNVPLVRGGSMNLKIVATRDAGFDAPINLQFPFRPPGVGTHPQAVIPKGQTETYYPLNANGNAQLGKWPVYVIGWADVEGPAWASTQLAELEIALPPVTIEMQRSACQQGQESSIYCKLNHTRRFEGEATAELLGVPPDILIEPLKFTSDSQELNFKVITNEKSPIGKHSGLFCRVTIMEHGEPIVSVAARSQLQITKPRPQTPVVAKTAPVSPPPAQAAPAATKPKSRLQQLREQAKRNGGQKE